MSNVNKVILLGRVGKINELRRFSDGKCVIEGSLATSEKYKNSSGVQQEKTEWHKIVMWSKTAEVFEKHVRVGALIFVEGRIKTEAYEDKEGIKKWVTKIVVSNLRMLGSKNSGSDQNSIASQSNSQPRNFKKKPEEQLKTTYNKIDF